ncbi:threonine-phosphate decarboxylase CobD [Desulfofundulus thermocisternus]|uniref:threonine-phosphate decarboxylase CobD n=1 Tax=Desulfofundulus thermocisternus TaxID=42471 RepID=UPI001A0B3313|nr:threonine-phosphate decarboxylase CobD [Desulfofundulus thermocisternus]MBE3586304.1 threonine-phosphate decarboxylase [Thermoanaerobacter sp.]MCS5695756.1 threonine-phosphate decarboxylase CobD [Desulfofundulus thermocisternus]
MVIYNDKINRGCQTVPPHGGNLVRASLEYGFAPQDFLDFSANINPLGPSPRVLEALKDNLWQISHYPDPDCRELKVALAEHLGVDPSCLLVGNGASELIYLLARVFPFRRALIPAPTFSEYALAVRAAGGEVKYIFLDSSRGFPFPLKEVLKLLPEADALFLCNPNNPTGGLVTCRELGFLLETALACGSMIIVDEAFMDFVQNPASYSLLCQAGRHHRLILLYSLTKILAIPGLRLGVLVARPEVVRTLEKARDPWSVNALAQVAGVAGLRDRAYLEATREVVTREREFLFQELSSLPGWRPFPGTANFLLVDITNAGITAGELTGLLGRRGILVRNCSNFPGLTEGYIRVAVKGHDENLRLLKVLGEVLQER